MRKTLRVCLVMVILLVFSMRSHGQSTGVWQKTFGGQGDDVAYCVQQTKDGGYVIAGGTDSFGAGDKDVYVVKIDAGGNLQWQRTFGGRALDEARFIQQTSDGGYIVAGLSTSFGVSSWADIYVIKLDAEGKKMWERTFGESDREIATCIQQTKDGGYIVVGHTESVESDAKDVYIIKLDMNGNKLWEKTFGGQGVDDASCVQETKDGGYIIAGSTEPLGTIWSDVYVIKLDVNGNKQWEKAFGGDKHDRAYWIQQTKDGGYIIAGSTESFGAGWSDVYVIKLDANGNKQWEKTFGGGKFEQARCIRQTTDDGYIFAGNTSSFGAGGADVYVVKLDAKGNTQWQKTFGSVFEEVGNCIEQTKDGGYIVVGHTVSFGAGYKDVYVIKMNAKGEAGPYPQ